MAFEIKIYKPLTHSPSLSEISLESLRENNLSAMRNCKLYSEQTISSKKPSEIKNEIALTAGDVVELVDTTSGEISYFFSDSEGNLHELLMNNEDHGITEGEEIDLGPIKKKKAPFDIGKAKPYIGKLKEASCPICGKKIVCLGTEEKIMGKEKVYLSSFFCDKCEATIEISTKFE